jgi:methylmalonyl-CoA mutase
MRDVFHAAPPACLFKLHTQTSGRSLIAHEYKNNLTRTALELLLACVNATNSCHSNSADEPFTTPSEEYVRLAAHAQAILLEESGLFKFMMNALSGAPGMQAVEQAVEAAILDEFRTIEELGGVRAATELRYQRSQIQAAAHRYETQINDGTRPIIGLNRYREIEARSTDVPVVRTPRSKQEKQARRVKDFKRRNRARAPKALARLARVVETQGNVFDELLNTVQHCSLGQITGLLHELVGKYRPTV